MQDPADDGIDAGVDDLVDLCGFEVVITTLPANKVEDNDETKNAEGGSAAPVDGGIAEEEVLDNCCSQSAESDV